MSKEKTSAPTIAIDLTPLYRGYGGINWYARELAHRLLTETDPLFVPVANIGDTARAGFSRMIYRKALWWRYLANLKADLYFFPHASVEPRFLKRHPSVVTIHDISAWHDPGTTTFVGRRTARSLPQVARFARKIITISEYSKKDIGESMNIDPTKIDIVPPGVADWFSPIPIETNVKTARLQKLLHDKSFLLHVGNWEPKKNIDFLLDRFVNLIAISNPDAVLVLTGVARWNMSRVLVELIENHPNVLVTGSVTQTELVWLYQNAKALVFPSKSEGFGMPVVEALACGTRTIVSDRASLPEFETYGAEIISLEEEEKWEKAMADALSRDSSAHGAPKQLHTIVQDEFSWDRSHHKLLSVLRSET